MLLRAGCPFQGREIHAAGIAAAFAAETRSCGASAGQSRRSRRANLLLGVSSLALGLSLISTQGHAVDATWNGIGLGVWNVGLNWSGGAVPNGTATFTPLGVPFVSFTPGTTSSVGALSFTAVAPLYTFNIAGGLGLNTNLTVSGVGIQNSSAFAPTFLTSGLVGGTGTLAFQGSAQAGNSNITNNANGITQFSGLSSAANATISNIGGTTGFIGLSTAGTANISAGAGGSITFQDTSNAGSAVLTANLGGSISFSGGSTGGTAQAIINAGGNLAIAGLSTGGMSIGSIEGAGAINLGAKALTVGGNNLSTTFSGAIGGVLGSLIKTGSGVLTLSGTSGYSGGTTVSGGTLVADGSIANSVVTVTGGATLGGSGTVGGLVAQSGATVAPGIVAPLSTLNVAGSVTLAAGSTFAVGLTGAGLSDKIAVTGSANLQGGTVTATILGGMVPLTSQFPILTAQGGVTGAFASVSLTNNLAFVDPLLISHPNDVVLAFVRNSVQFSSVGSTPNERAVGAAIEGLGSSNSLNAAVLGLSASQARNAFDLASGEIHASAVSAAFEDARLPREAILDRLWNPSRGAVALLPGGMTGPMVTKAPVSQPLQPSGFTAWAQGFGNFGRIGGDGNAADVSRSLGGFIAGTDTQVDGRFRFGLAAGYTQSWLSVGSRASSGSIESVFGGLYGGADLGQLRLRAGALFAHNSYDTNRTIVFPGFVGMTQSSYGGSTAQAFGEAGWRFDIAPGTSVEPFAGVLAMRIHTDDFAESGGAAALQGQSRSYDYQATTLGVRAEAVPIVGIPVTVSGLLGWRHTFGDLTPTALLAFASAPTTFAITGAPIARDSLVAEAGLDYYVRRNISVGAFYSSAGDGHTFDNAVKGRIQVTF